MNQIKSTPNQGQRGYLDTHEEKALRVIEAIRWPDGVICPYCGSDQSYPLSVKSVKRRRWKCRKCRRQYTVTKGTMLEGSRVPLTQWLLAIEFLTTEKRLVTVSQLMREVGFSYRAALNILLRIRYASRQGLLGKAVQYEGLDGELISSNPCEPALIIQGLEPEAVVSEMVYAKPPCARGDQGP